MKILGLLALSCYALHAGNLVWCGRPEEILWACHLAAVLVGVGLLGRLPRLVAVGVLWLVAGVPLWLYDLWAGGISAVTSPLTHLGGLAIGLVGIRRLRVPAGSWWQALLGLIALQELCRWVTPREANVNAAFSVYPWMQPLFTSYFLYCSTMVVLFGLAFFLEEFALRRLVSR